jgi:tetratricopeptide (TPR) repeat protein
VLRARERAATDRDARKTLMVRLGQNLADKLSDVTEAILAYRAVIDEFGAEMPLLSALATLYEVADRYDDLAETLDTELGMAEQTSDRLALLAKLGDVRRSRLKDLPAALETYRQALTLDPSHGASRAALEELLGDETAKREAASILRPLYEADGEQAKLLRVLDIEVEFGDTVEERLGVLSQAVVVAEQSLNDVPRAFGYAARALREAAGDPELRPWMERAERLAVAAGKHADFVELLRGVAPDVLDESMQLEVLIKVAELAREKLSDAKLSRDYYEKALQIRADERRPLEALESLYREAQDWTALHDVLKRRAESAENDAERKEFLFKDAKLADETMNDPKSAIEVYEQILEIGTDNAAFDALERLYEKTERFDDLVSLYERRLGMEVDDDTKALTHAKLGGVYHDRLKDTDRAFDAYEAALKIEAQHGPTVAALEKLMTDPAHAARAAEMLESVYLARLDWRRVMESLQARLAASQDPDERRTLLKRLAKLHEEQEENYAAAVEVSAKLLAEDVNDEDTWAELERLSRVANARGRLAEIFATELEKVTSDEPTTAKLAARTGELFEEQKNVDRALVFYRRAYAFAPEESQSAFEGFERRIGASYPQPVRV